jgi:predicted nucleic acid-binding protein
LEDAVLDSDALIDAYDLGVEKFSGVHTTHISLYEFLRGLAYLGKSVAEYKSYIESNLEVLPIDNRAIILAATVHAGLKKKGAMVEDPDLLIACVCIANHLPIVTGNVKHFERFARYGLTVIPVNEFVSSVRPA